MTHTIPLLIFLASCLFCTVISQVENSSEETERDPDREGKFISTPFGRLSTDSVPCSSAEDSVVDPSGIVISRIFVEEKEPPSKSEISELLQLLREFKKHNFRGPQHWGHSYDPASFHPVHHPAHNGEEIITPTGAMGYVPMHPYSLPLNPYFANLCGFGPCSNYHCRLHNHTSGWWPQNQGVLEQTLSQTTTARPISTTGFGNTFTTPSAVQDPFYTPLHPTTNSFLAQPAESFEEVIIQKHQQNVPNYSSWPYPQTTTEEVVATERYYRPLSDPVNVYNPASYRTLSTVPMTTIEEISSVYGSPVLNSYSTPSPILEEVTATYYPSTHKTHKSSLLKSPDDILSTHYPANHRRVYAEDITSAFGGDPTAALIAAEELAGSPYPSRHRTHYTASDLTRYMPQSHLPATVSVVEESVVDFPVTYTEGYYPNQYSGRYGSSSGYASSDPLAVSGYNRPHYSRYPMYQTNG